MLWVSNILLLSARWFVAHAASREVSVIELFHWGGRGLARHPNVCVLIKIFIFIFVYFCFRDFLLFGFCFPWIIRMLTSYLYSSLGSKCYLLFDWLPAKRKNLVCPTIYAVACINYYRIKYTRLILSYFRTK